MTKTTTRLAAVALAAVAAAAGVGACGDDGDELRDHAATVQQQAQRMADEVRAGERDPMEAAEELREDAAELAGEVIDEARDTPGVPDAVADQLEQTQQQVEAGLDDD